MEVRKKNLIILVSVICAVAIIGVVLFFYLNKGNNNINEVDNGKTLGGYTFITKDKEMCNGTHK